MKSPSYILKSNYLERNQQRSFEQHVKKLEEINVQPPCLGAMQKSHQITRQLDVRHKNLHIATKFNEMETDIKRNRENESLLEKIKNLQIKSLAQLKLTSKSLISGCKRKEENRIILENFNMAKRMINLPPVISYKKLDLEYIQHKSDLNLVKKYHTYKPLIQNVSKYSLLYEQLQHSTMNQFSKTKSGSNFGYIQKQITAHNYLCLIDIKSTKLSSKHTSSSSKNMTQFFWEVKSEGKSLCKTSSKDFKNASTQLLDCIASSKSDLELILFKVKNNDEIYVGQVELPYKEFVETDENIIDHNIRQIRESRLILKPINIVIDSNQAPIGIIQLKIITVYGSSTNKPSFAIQEKTQGIDPNSEQIQQIKKQISLQNLTEANDVVENQALPLDDQQIQINHLESQINQDSKEEN